METFGLMEPASNGDIKGGQGHMKNLKLISSLVVAAMLFAVVAPHAAAEGEQADAITITIDRAVKPQSFFHIGRFFAPRREATLTVYDPIIRNYDGRLTEKFTIQTASGRTDIPIDSVQAIRLNNWIERRTEDIPQVEWTVNANILLTDGTQKQVLMNADFGTIEGRTDRGEFFLKDPHTVRFIEFHR